MSHDLTTPPHFSHRRALLLTLFGVGVVALGLVLAPRHSPQNRGEAPTYETLRTVFGNGDGKQEEEGQAELFQFDPTVPTAWMWTAPDPNGGPDVETWLLGPTYVKPVPPDAIPMTWVVLSGLDVETLSEFIDWIVQTHDHVPGPESLAIEKR